MSAALASYDAVSVASVTVLYQRLRTLLLLGPPTPEFTMKMRRTGCEGEGWGTKLSSVYRTHQSQSWLDYNMTL